MSVEVGCFSLKLESSVKKLGSSVGSDVSLLSCKVGCGNFELYACESWRKELTA